MMASFEIDGNTLYFSNTTTISSVYARGTPRLRNTIAGSAGSIKVRVIVVYGIRKPKTDKCQMWPIMYALLYESIVTYGTMSLDGSVFF